MKGLKLVEQLPGNFLERNLCVDRESRFEILWVSALSRQILSSSPWPCGNAPRRSRKTARLRMAAELVQNSAGIVKGLGYIKPLDTPT